MTVYMCYKGLSITHSVTNNTSNLIPVRRCRVARLQGEMQKVLDENPAGRFFSFTYYIRDLALSHGKREIKEKNKTTSERFKNLHLLTDI